MILVYGVSFYHFAKHFPFSIWQMCVNNKLSQGKTTTLRAFVCNISDLYNKVHGEKLYNLKFNTALSISIYSICHCHLAVKILFITSNHCGFYSIRHFINIVFFNCKMYWSTFNHTLSNSIQLLVLTAPCSKILIKHRVICILKLGWSYIIYYIY